MNLKTKLYYNGRKTVKLYLNHSVYFNTAAEMFLKAAVENFKKYPINKDRVLQFHDTLNNLFNFLIHNRYLSLWKNPYLDRKLERDKCFSKVSAPILQTNEIIKSTDDIIPVGAIGWAVKPMRGK